MYVDIKTLSLPQQTVMLFVALHEKSVTIEEIINHQLFDPEVVWKTLESLVHTGGITREYEGDTTLFSLHSDILLKDILSNADDDAWKHIFTKTNIAKEHLTRFAITPYAFHTAIAYNRFFPPPSFDDGDINAIRAFAISAFAHVLPILPLSTLIPAIEIAVAHGDVATQAILYSCVDVEELSTENEKALFHYFDSARELATLQNDFKILVFVMKTITFKMAMLGRLKETISYYEAFMEEIDSFVQSLDYNSLDKYTEQIIGSAYVSNGLISFCYYMQGQYSRAMSILFDMIEKAKSLGSEPLKEAARGYLVHIFAEQGDVEKAEYFSAGNLELWLERQRESAFSWHASIGRAAIAMLHGDVDEVRKYLEMGDEFRRLSGFTHHFGSILMNTLEWYDIHGKIRLKTLSLDSEIKRLLDSSDVNMHGVALFFKAKKLYREEGDFDGVGELLLESCSYLRQAGALPALQKSLHLFCELSKKHNCFVQERREAEREIESIAGWISPFEPAQSEQVEQELFNQKTEQLILSISNLVDIVEGVTDPWHYISSRMLHFLGAGKVALIDITMRKDEVAPTIFAHAGGGGPWLKKITAFVRRHVGSEMVSFHDSLISTEMLNVAGSVLVLIPYRSEKWEKKGFICLESLRIFEKGWKKNSSNFAKVGRHFVAIYENVKLWQSLQHSKTQLETENLYYRAHSFAQSFEDIVGESDAVVEMKQLIEKVAPLDVTVLIQGETGSGKELVARAIYKNSQRKNAPFVVVNMASISHELMASTLFGHERGAFTGAVSRSKGLFEMADGGTLFLDEIGDMPLETQAHLLRVLQEGRFKRIGSEKDISSDFRMIAATNKNLEEEVKAGRFRQDLFYRLHVFPIVSPPLRKRKSDIPLLISFFMKRFSRSIKKSFKSVRQEDMDRLMEYRWPGNIRELEHIIERACVLSTPPFLTIPDVTGASLSSSPSEVQQLTLDQAIKQVIVSTLKRTKGKIHGEKGAAALLDVKPSTLYSKIEKYGLKNELKKSFNTREKKRGN